MRQFVKSKLLKVLTLPLALIALGIFSYINWRNLLSLFLSINYSILILSCFVAGLAIILNSLKVSLLTNAVLSRKIVSSEFVLKYVESYLLNLFLPYTGHIYRALHLKNRYQISYTEYIGIAYTASIISISMLMFLATIFWTIVYHESIYILLFLIALFLVVVKMFILKKITGIYIKNSLLNGWVARLKVFYINFSIFLKSKLIYQIGVFFLVAALIEFVVYWLATKSLDLPISLTSSIVIYLAYSFSWVLRLTPANVGVQELIFSIAGTLVGLSPINSVALSILLRVCYLIGAALAWVATRLSDLSWDFQTKRF